MKQSILLTYHKNKEMLFFCLKRLLKTVPEDVEIVIIGNNVKREELDFEIKDSRYKYYKIYQNLQYPKALNFGVEKCAAGSGRHSERRWVLYRR